MNNTLSYWNILKNNFKDIIINNTELNKKYNFLKNYEFNVLLYTVYGFPLDLFIDEVIKYKYNLNTINKFEYTWEKTVVYYETPYFFEIDLMNPTIPKDFNFLNKFILHVLKNKNITDRKHLIIIKHIDVLKDNFSVLKILFESFSTNAFFICTTFSISSIENAIISRFASFRIPLFTNIEIQNIFNKYFNINLNNYLIINNSRNIILCIFIATVEEKEPHLITNEFCNLNYPPLYDFMKNFNKKRYNLEAIRSLSYNCFQYNIKLSQILSDILKIIPNKNKQDILKHACDLEHKLVLTNKAREPLYIEALLCYVLL